MLSRTMRPDTATSSIADPARSTLAPVCLTRSRRKRPMPKSVTTPNGTLNQKTQAQSKLATIRPPSSGPRTEETPHTLAR